MELEEWRDIPGYPGYKASSFGRILGKKGKEIGCFTHKYVVCGLGFGKIPKTRHQLIAAAFLPPKPFNDAEIDHIDRNKHNDRPSNLRWADRYDQMANRNVMKNSKSGVKGLMYEPITRRWKCNIRHQGLLHQMMFRNDERENAEKWLEDTRKMLGI